MTAKCSVNWQKVNERRQLEVEEEGEREGEDDDKKKYENNSW